MIIFIELLYIFKTKYVGIRIKNFPLAFIDQ